MKYLSRVFFIVSVILSLTACNDIVFTEEFGGGEVPVNVAFDMSGKVIQTKSKVSGTDNKVTTMQMVCFDANGLYLGIRGATVISDNANPDTGKIKGTVPQGTARIHFIANRNLTVPLSFTIGTKEETVMNSEELSTIWNDENHQEICYWGYHKETSEAAMQGWLNPKSTDPKSLVYMIRDRAKVVLTYDPTDAKVAVTKIEWLIHNGRERGYLAPAKEYWGNESYYGYSTAEGHTDVLVSVAGINEYTNCGRYSLWTSNEENDENNFDVAYQSTGTYTSKAQYLFEDDNTDLDDVKVILRVTYKPDGEDPKTVYHTLRLNDDDRVKYDIVRNNTYYIKCKLLSPDVAYYETLKEAIDGDEFVNAETEVDRTIPDINDNTYTLQIKLPTETTSIVLNTEGAHTDLNFVFRNISDLSAGSTNPNDFEVKWEKPQTFCSSELPVAYNSNTQQFTITATVLEGKLTNQLQSEWIVVKHKTTGLTRYIHVFVIDQFRYKLYPTLKAVQNGNATDYVLTFKIPQPDYSNPDNPDHNELIYPASLYPIDIKFTTNTLNAYGTTLGTTNYGLFGVSVEGTSQLCTAANFETGYNSPVSSTNYNADRTHWYYQQENNYWDFWYTYSLKNYPEDPNPNDDVDETGLVKIYFKDVRSHISYAQVADVGLFLYVEYFGKNYSVPVTTN